MNYIITKRTECDRCHGEEQYIYSKYNPTDKFVVKCLYCSGMGYRESTVDFDEVLLSRLAKLRWDAPLPNYRDIVIEKQMRNPRFDGMEISDETA